MIKQINENYSVDALGNVYSKPRPGTKGGLLKKSLTAKGYEVVTIMPLNIPVKVHRLVATLFVPNPDSKPFVNHKNGIKTDNSAENLEWVTTQENAQHAYDTGLQVAPVGEDNPSSKLSEQDVLIIRARFKSKCRKNGARAIARELGVAYSTIWRAVNGISWTHV